MRVGVGYSENPDTHSAGREAALEALKQAESDNICDFVLMFSTARHDAKILHDSVADVLGDSVPFIGGGALGAICNDRFGYAGDQVILAAFWLQGVHCELLSESGLLENEEESGKRLGQKLAKLNVTPTSPILFFYDAIDHTSANVRLIMATLLLQGIEQGLGFLPDLLGAGLQGDYICTPTRQWIGTQVTEHRALALAFDDAVHIDHVIMHGCRPATGYYTVTKADKQAILEINGEPALRFLDKLLGPKIQPEDYPFFLILGINKGDKWGDFDEKNYVNHLCLAIDKEHDAIIMFESDMLEGTEFQVMYRSLDLDYMPPRIEKLFDHLGGRKPVLALYINCAGRAAGFGGSDMEDAVVVQKTLAGRVPLMGVYSGVEIASVVERPRGLDWTGVFCLISVPNENL